MEEEDQGTTKRVQADNSRHESTIAHQIAMTQSNNVQPRGGLDFYTLARGGERSYSVSFLVNLDPDLLSLCSREDASTLDLARDALISHTKRILSFVTLKSGREVNQFCFGSTYVQLNPNYRRFDKMDPVTWKKEGIAQHWTGARGYRKICCKNCCSDRNCSGCKNCRGCVNGPVRGNYDGLVVLCAITRESLPNQPVVVSRRQAISKNQLGHDKLPDHELFTLSLESLLSTHFMYGDDDYQAKCVPSSRIATIMGDNQEDVRKAKKYSGYVVYVAYRLEPKSLLSHSQKLNKVKKSDSIEVEDYQTPPSAADTIPEEEEEDEEKRVNGTATGNNDDDLETAGGGGTYFSGFQWGAAVPGGDEDDVEFGGNNNFGGDDDEDEKLLEDLEDKQLLGRIKDLEGENSKLTEQIWKLEHGKTWLENRLNALESEVEAIKGAPLSQVEEPPK